MRCALRHPRLDDDFSFLDRFSESDAAVLASRHMGWMHGGSLGRICEAFAAARAA